MPRKTDKIAARIRDELEREMRMITAEILAESKRQVPVDEGTLRRSAKREQEWHGSKLVATISYNTPYAAKQHEDTNLTHNAIGRYGRARQGKAKYLEDPVKQFRPKVEQRLKAAMRRAIT